MCSHSLSHMEHFLKNKREKNMIITSYYIYAYLLWYLKIVSLY